MALVHQIAVIDKYLKKQENKLCADCKRSSPSWASINLGVFVCIKCSGCHREIGVHITKIKSTNLDLWPANILANFGKISMIKLTYITLITIDNQIANCYWEQKLPSDFDFEKLKKDDYRLQDFIRDKYERRRYTDIKKVDPMTLITQGYDITKDEIPHNGSSVWGDDENTNQKTHTNVKTKPGPNFNITSNKGEKKSVHQEKMFCINNTSSVNNTNNQLRVNGNNTTSGNNTSNNDKKTSGFSFIKKNNTIPKTNIINPKSAINNDIDQIISVKSVTSNNENLLELYSVQTQPPKAVQDLSDNISKAYQASITPNANPIQINMNQPNINITNYYQHPNIEPVNQPNIYQPQYPMMNQPYVPPIQPVNNGYYMNKPNPIPQPYVLELYNPVKTDKITPEESLKFTYNSNYTDSLNPKKNNDPFKNLVSFN